jgi:hypothetical protein
VFTSFLALPCLAFHLHHFAFCQLLLYYLSLCLLGRSEVVFLDFHPPADSARTQSVRRLGRRRGVPFPKHFPPHDRRPPAAQPASSMTPSAPAKTAPGAAPSNTQRHDTGSAPGLTWVHRHDGAAGKVTLKNSSFLVTLDADGICRRRRNLLVDENEDVAVGSSICSVVRPSWCHLG